MNPTNAALYVLPGTGTTRRDPDFFLVDGGVEVRPGQRYISHIRPTGGVEECGEV